MADMVTYPLNNIKYDASDAELYNATRTSGVYAKDDFAISLTGADNIITVGTGLAWIRNSKFSGKVVANKNNKSLDMGLANANSPRWDVVCIQFDKTKNETNIIKKTGVASASPQLPAISRTETLYELYLAKIYRRAGAVSITQDVVFDLRLDSAVCGLMADSITKINTTSINAQISELITKLNAEIESVKTESALMLKSVYDTDNDGVVDNAEKLGGKTVNDIIDDISLEFVKKTGDEMTGGLALKKNYRPTLYFRHENGEEIASVYADNDTARFMISVSATDQKSYKEVYSLPVPPTGMNRSKWYDIMTSKGGKFVGNVTLAGEPTADLHPATKKYVDAVKTIANAAMPKNGGAFTGNVSVEPGKRLDFINKDGGRLRIIGGSQSNTTAIRIVDSNNETVTELLQVDTQTGDFVGGKLAKGTEVLWENASVTSAFDSQTLTISNLSKYQGIWIIYRYDKGDDTRFSVYIPTKLSSRGKAGCTVSTLSTANQYYREASVWGNTVQIGNAFMIGGVQNNNYAIPVAIYGIK